jgi:hypothetical protein
MDRHGNRYVTVCFPRTTAHRTGQTLRDAFGPKQVVVLNNPRANALAGDELHMIVSVLRELELDPRNKLDDGTNHIELALEFEFNKFTCTTCSARSP